MQRKITTGYALVLITCAGPLHGVAAQVTVSGARTDPGSERVEGKVRLERPEIIPVLIETIRNIAVTDSIGELDGNTIRFVANAGEAGLAEWLAGELTNSNPSSQAVGHEYIMPADDNDVILVIRDVRVGAPVSIRPPHIGRSEELQEIRKSLRILCDLRVTEFSPAHALIWRGAPRESQFAGFLVGEFGNPPASDWQQPASYAIENGSPWAVRLFYFPENFRVLELEKLAFAIRMKTRSDRVAAVSCVRTIVVRGTDNQAAAAEKLVDNARRKMK